MGLKCRKIAFALCLALANEIKLKDLEKKFAGIKPKLWSMTVNLCEIADKLDRFASRKESELEELKLCREKLETAVTWFAAIAGALALINGCLALPAIVVGAALLLRYIYKILDKYEDISREAIEKIKGTANDLLDIKRFVER